MAKGFAVGFRIEHPQELINCLQLGPDWAPLAAQGKGKLPVADYRLATEIPYPQVGGVSLGVTCPPAPGRVAWGGFFGGPRAGGGP